MRILFCNIGWMNHYNGQKDNDKLENGGSYTEEYGTGIEEFTFQNRNGYYYGGTGLSGSMNIERIQGVSKDATKVENVLVVWVAKKGKEQNSKIVGWYKNATVYREFQEFNTLDNERDVVVFRVKTKAEDGVLLIPTDRTFIMPRASKSKDGVGMGRSNIWYADNDEAKPFIEKVVKYINEFNKKQCNLKVTEDILNRKTLDELECVDDYINKANILLESNNNRTALEYINKAIDIDPEYEYAHNIKGIILLELGLYDLAIESFNNALIDEDYSDPIFNKGLAYGMDGNLDKALECFKEYDKVCPKCSDTHRYIDLIYRYKNMTMSY